MGSGIDLVNCLPHTPPMLLLGEILDFEAKTLRAKSVIKFDNPLLENNLFPCAAGIELFAQAGGVLFAQIPGQPAGEVGKQNGAVILLKKFKLGQIQIGVGSELIISATYVAGTKQAAQIEGDVYLGDEMVFEGSLMIALFKESNHVKP